MFRKSFQKGFFTVFYAGGASPLKIWDRMVVNGHVKRVTDEDVRTLALEMRGCNVATCYIYTPIDPKEVLGITLPFLVMIIKNLKKYFSFEVQILDDRNMRRRFRVSNYQTTTKVRPFGTTMPIGLNPGWNQIQFNLADFTKRAYGSVYVETQRIQVHANCRIRRIYFCDKLYSDDELPNDYKLFYPCVEEKGKKDMKKTDVRDEVPPPSEVGEEMELEEIGEEEGEYIETESPEAAEAQIEEQEPLVSPSAPPAPSASPAPAAPAAPAAPSAPPADEAADEQPPDEAEAPQDEATQDEAATGGEPEAANADEEPNEAEEAEEAAAAD